VGKHRLGSGRCIDSENLEFFLLRLADHLEIEQLELLRDEIEGLLQRRRARSAGDGSAGPDVVLCPQRPADLPEADK
jgi:hypothetical protein